MLVSLLSALVLVVVYISFWTPIRKEQIFGHETVYFYGNPTVEPLSDYGHAFSVGHNAGSSVATIAEARANGARIIEIDVVMVGDQLMSAHVPPMRVIGSYVFRGPSLASVWEAAGDAAVIQLDLKDSSPAFRTKVISFLQEHAGERPVLVTTADVTMLRMLRDETPEAIRFMSVPDAGVLNRVLEDHELAALIDGVTIRYQLVNRDSVSMLKERGLIVLAWTVNDLRMVNEFIELGVDGVSTNNLAIMELLSSDDPVATLQSGRTSPGIDEVAFEPDR